jgi:hypothetical protein
MQQLLQKGFRKAENCAKMKREKADELLILHYDSSTSSYLGKNEHVHTQKDLLCCQVDLSSNPTCTFIVWPWVNLFAFSGTISFIKCNRKLVIIVIIMVFYYLKVNSSFHLKETSLSVTSCFIFSQFWDFWTVQLFLTFIT